MHSNHSGPAYSHELKPQYGGMVAEVEEVVYELVLRPGGVTIYVTERDKPVSTQAASGSLTIRSATKTLEATLIPAGTNELRAAADLAGIDVKAAVAHISLAKKGLETVRFSAKRKAIAVTPGG